MARLLRKTFLQRLSEWIGGGKPYPNTAVRKETLPKLPLPDLKATLSKYQEYASVISTEPTLLDTRKKTQAFENGAGLRAQAVLDSISKSEENWHNTYWLRDMYLKARCPLPVFSNPAYLFPKQNFSGRDDLVRYIATLAQGVNSYKDLIEQRSIPLDRSTGKGGGEPMCMDQYWRTFNSHREPCIDEDAQHVRIKKPRDQYFMLLRKNAIYKIYTTNGAHALPTAALVDQIKAVLDETDRVETTDRTSVSLLTAIDRDKGAKTKEELFKCDDHNKASWKSITEADFAVCVDPPLGSQNYDPDVRDHLVHLLHGRGTANQSCNRWFDKTHQFIVCEDGHVGLNFEHSIAEGIVLVSLVEHVLAYIDDNLTKKPFNSGNLGRVEPKQITWSVSRELKSSLEDAQKDMDKLAADLQLEVLEYDTFGKGFLKRSKVSPDACIQLALQLAHFKCHDCLVSTYESASTRRFRYGRVDNIRSAHPQALAWAKIMSDSVASQAAKMESFRCAIAKQTKVMLDNVTGYGIDNHLAALNEICRVEKLDDTGFFSDDTYKELLRFPLSTSQVPMKREGTYVCYGPVVEDGYSACYNPQEDSVTFVLGALESNPRTDLKRFRECVVEAFDDLHSLLSV